MLLLLMVALTHFLAAATHYCSTLTPQSAAALSLTTCADGLLTLKAVMAWALTKWAGDYYPLAAHVKETMSRKHKGMLQHHGCCTWACCAKEPAAACRRRCRFAGWLPLFTAVACLGCCTNPLLDPTGDASSACKYNIAFQAVATTLFGTG